MKMGTGEHLVSDHRSAISTTEQGARHTPGPWRVAPSHHYSPTSLHIDAGPNGLSSYICEVGQRGDKRAEADARLIAAAPDLLAACQEFVRKVDAGEAKSKRSYAQMKVAIAKATGARVTAQSPAADAEGD